MALLLAACWACSNQNPDQIRQKTAEETATIKRDTKAVAEGIKDGLSNKKSVDLNKAPSPTYPRCPASPTSRWIASSPSARTRTPINW